MDFRDRVEAARDQVAEAAREAAQAKASQAAAEAAQREAEDRAQTLLLEAVGYLWKGRRRPKSMPMMLGGKAVLLHRTGQLTRDHGSGDIVRQPFSVIRVDANDRLQIVAEWGSHQNTESELLDFEEWLAYQVALLTTE